VNCSNWQTSKRTIVVISDCPHGSANWTAWTTPEGCCVRTTSAEWGCHQLHEYGCPGWWPCEGPRSWCKGKGEFCKWTSPQSRDICQHININQIFSAVNISPNFPLVSFFDLTLHFSEEVLLRLQEPLRIPSYHIVDMLNHTEPVYCGRGFLENQPRPGTHTQESRQ
jgi:hypothetical protein